MRRDVLLDRLESFFRRFSVLHGMQQLQCTVRLSQISANKQLEARRPYLARVQWGPVDSVRFRDEVASMEDN
jgi:hypothetical protein